MIIYMNLNNKDMTRINDLPKEIRLDLIEETRLQQGSEWTDLCIERNFSIAGMCDWSRTRQGVGYWAMLDTDYLLR
jgi:hypothetical protein